MKSGDPAPKDDLKLLIERKRNQAGLTMDVVSEASNWLKAQLKGAGVSFHYAACEAEDHYGFAVMVISRWKNNSTYFLELRLAEIGEQPFLFAEVRAIGKTDASLFPYFGEIHSEEGRNLAMHYIADFLLSTESDS